ncbi:HTH-type transcriptional regulator ilvY [Enterobacter cloacae]|uniref:HTH-type transcriptional regulator ilvY n=1 Tax=Enterobacter cloacae TaxID=550 RepID=A0A377LS20_ENTCL|nr:HTH-type transcriptional regulator ilvY [Enterobacter cloacae]
MYPHYNRKFIAEIDIFTTSRCNICNVKRGVESVDLRDLKMFLHLAESRHFGRSARAMHVSPSTLSRQIQRP